MICLPIQAFENRNGVVYAEASDPTARFNDNDVVFMQGLAPIAAGILEDAAYIDWLKAQNARLRDDLKLRNPLIGDSPPMMKLKETIRKIAPMNSTVLIQGESGTGKEVIARAIHDNSERREALFVAINCGAIPENLLESELFGHEKGAFTGAMTLFERGQALRSWHRSESGGDAAQLPMARQCPAASECHPARDRVRVRANGFGGGPSRRSF
jgi:transcriptional regulator with GAF, ATPase, and Fis domain